MKSKLSAILVVFCSLSAISQIAPPPEQPNPGQTPQTQDASGLKAGDGDVTFEMNLTPFSASPLSISYLRARYFMSESMAMRVGFSVGIQNTSPNKSFSWALIPGIEKHFAGTDRLSPFIGAELSLAGKASSSSITEEDLTTTTKGSWSENDDYSNRGYFNLGINAVVGCDFYIARHFYLGLEAGYGLGLMSFSDLTISEIENGGTTTTTTSKGGSSFQLGPNFNSAVRIGFVF